MSNTSQELLALLARLDAALDVRRRLLARQQAMIDEWKQTGVRSDPFEWAYVRDSVPINRQTIVALRDEIAKLRQTAPKVVAE